MRLILAALFCLLCLPAAAQEGCDYDIRIKRPESPVIEGDIHCPAGVAAFAARPVVMDQVRLADATGKPLKRVEQTWPAAGGTRFRYAIDLGDYAKRGGRGVLAVGRSLLATGDVWIPWPLPLDTPVRLRIEGDDVVTGLDTEGEGGAELSAAALARAGYMAFGAIRRSRIAPDSAVIDLVHLDGTFALGAEQLDQWVAGRAAAVGRFYGSFPVPRSLVILAPIEKRRHVASARTIAGGGVTTGVLVGADVDQATLARDDLLTRGMVRAALPYLTDDATWLMDGVATYVDPIIRARAGWIAPEALWALFGREMARGQDALSRTGMRRAGFGALSWGGALFMLMTDVEMRRQSAGKRGLEHCLRALARQGVSRAQRWTTADFVEACDRATGGNVMATHVGLYYHHGGPVDLDKLWGALGIDLDDGRAVLRDDAADAAIREAIVWGNADGIRPPPLPNP